MPETLPEIEELRRRAAEMLRKRQLPARMQEKFATFGSGIHCRLCGTAITAEQVEYAVADPSAPGETSRLHIWCHAAWELEVLNAS